jgi:dinuclear metal center YbgI/SA1388 family protein
MVKREELQDWLHATLQVANFKDYCPNGLQVEGKSRIIRLACAVTASRYVIERAIEEKADALVVHHGLFWRNDDPSVVGVLRGRLAPALKAGLNLFAYHLPLDAHPQWGNNVQLAHALGLTALLSAPPEPVSQGSLVWMGTLKKPLNAQQFARLVERRLKRVPTLVVPADKDEAVTRIAWCTGGAQGYLPEAAAAGAQLYLSGEISEPTTHLARELGVVYCAAGHHATERYGVQALTEGIAERFSVATWFIDEDNPA